MRRLAPHLLLLALVVLVQQLTQWTETPYYLTQLTMAAYYSLVIVGLCLLMGYAGQVSIGHAGFFAMGGYLSAMLTTVNLSTAARILPLGLLERLGLLVARQDIFGEQILSMAPPWAAVVALTVTALTAVCLGIPVLKLKGHYLAMATLGFGIIIYRIALATPIFGEADGISDVPPFSLPAGLAISGDFAARVSNYYLAWALVLVVMVLLANLIDSRVGRALKAIHTAEDAARAMGVDTPRYKLVTFVISALLAAMGGILLTHYNGGIGPSEAGIIKSVRYVAIVAVGGMANLWGALTMGVVLNFCSLRGLFGTYDDAVFGMILIVIMLFAPHGLLSRATWEAVLRKVRRDS